MTGYVKEPHTTIFTCPTGCRKTHLVLRLIEKKYNKHFDYIIIVYPTLRWNKTCYAKDWIKNDDKAWLAEPRDRLYQWVEKLSQLTIQKHYLLSMISSLMKALIKKATPIRIGHLRQTSWPLFMAANTVLCCHTKKFKEAGQGHIRVVPKGKGRT